MDDDKELEREGAERALQRAYAEWLVDREVREGRLIRLDHGQIIEKERFDPRIHRLRESE
jgi:hypothetical protein